MSIVVQGLKAIVPWGWARAVAVAVGAACIGLSSANAQDLSFESDTLGGVPLGWHVTGPGVAAFRVSVEAVRGGSGKAMRIERVAPGGFVIVSAGTVSLPGRAVAVRVRARLRPEGVTSRISGIFVTMRDADGRVVNTDNMNGRPVVGSSPWTEVETVLPVLPGAERLEFGPTLAGRAGTLWADDFRVDFLTREDVGEPSDEALAYALSAVDTLAVHALRRDSVDWAVVRARVEAGIMGAQLPSDTYDAVGDAARFVDRHSSLIRPERLRVMRADSGASAVFDLPSARLLEPGVGYVTVPTVSVLDAERGRSYANALIAGLVEIETAGACGWVIDLRDNHGGNMFPMLSGLQPLLGGDDLGYFVMSDGRAEPWFVVPVGANPDRSGTAVAGVASLKGELRVPEAPVAVLVGPGTTSSGEVVALSFRGRRATVLIGAPTAGFTTGNEFHELEDGAVLNITTSVYADRTGRRYGQAIEPDIVVPENDDDEDRILAEAVRWLGGRGCGEGSNRGPESGAR